MKSGTFVRLLNDDENDQTAHDDNHEETDDPGDLFCMCKTSWEDGVFYIGCNYCENWYHDHCIGITEKAAEGIEKFKCPTCIENSEETPRDLLHEVSDLQFEIEELEDRLNKHQIIIETRESKISETQHE